MATTKLFKCNFCDHQFESESKAPCCPKCSKQTSSCLYTCSCGKKEWRSVYNSKPCRNCQKKLKGNKPIEYFCGNANCKTEIFIAYSSTMATCPDCGKMAGKRKKLCADCNETYLCWGESKYCPKCAKKRRNYLKNRNINDDISGVPADVLKGKPERIQQIIKYNWWTNRDFCIEVGKCEKVEDAEKLLLDLNRYYGKMQYSSGDNSYVTHI